MNTGVLFLSGLGCVFIAVALVYRLGLWPTGRRRARWYHTVRRNPDLPDDLRLGIKALLPVGVGLLVLAAAIPVIPRNVFVALALVVVALLVMLLGPAVIPSRWLEPAWVRDEERREEEGLSSTLPMPPEGRRLVVSPWLYWAMWIGLGVYMVVALVLPLHPAGVAAGLAVALPWLLATRRRTKQAGDESRGPGSP